jgi:hypothetical protein
MRLILLWITSTVLLHAQVTPELVAPGLIADNGVFGFTLSPNGDEAFWVKSNGGRDTLLIMWAKYKDGTWTRPELAPFSGNVLWKDIDPVFAPDGKTVLFQSNRPVAGKPARTGFDIWAVQKKADGWSAPYHLGNNINTDESESFASITKAGTIYFMKSNPDGKGQSDIFYSERKQELFGTPVNVGAPINTTFRESNPYISAKGDFLIYFSSDSTGYGDVDLFISFKKNGQWTKPKNLGNVINSSTGEFCPFYHAPSKRLYFCRTEQVPGKKRKENVFVISFDPYQYRE